MKRKRILLVITFSICFLSYILLRAFLSESVYASFVSKQDCLNNSGGHQNISSVIWACNEIILHPERVDAYGRYNWNACATWLGSPGTSTSAGAEIWVNSLSGEEAISYYGMCTREPDTASALYVVYPEGTSEEDKYITGIGTFTRGWWAHPTSASATLRVAKFVSGLTPTDCYTNDKCYDRNITLARCHSNTPSCSTQVQLLRVVLSRNTLSGKAIDDSNNSLSNVIGDPSSSTVNYNSKATITRNTHDDYTFLGWKEKKTDTSYTGGTGASYTVNNLTSDTEVYAVYKRKPTLTAYARDTGGNLLQSSAFCTVTVDYNTSASCTRPDIANYNFEGWSTSSSGSKVSSTDATYTVNNLTSDTTVYAVYTIQKKTLTAISCNTSGSSLASKSGLGNVSSTVDYNKKASVTRGTNPGYTFIGWRNVLTCWVAKDTANYTKTKSDDSETYVSGSATPAETFNVEHLRESGTVVAMYQVQQRTLTGVAVNESGTTISAISNVTATVDYEQKASIRRRDAAGYTFKGWRKKATDSTYTGGTDDTYSVNSLTDNTTVYAVYVRNKFSGQASVAEGTDWNGTTNRAVTGYYPHASGSGTSTSININCENAGCQANFWLQLKRDAGSGSTSYRTKSSTNGNGTAWILASPNAYVADSFPDSGSTFLAWGEGFYVGKKEDLVPGGSHCRYIMFKPYGDYGNDEFLTVHACASAKVTYFEGLSKVKGSTSTGWTSTTKNVRHVIQNCSPTDGCDVVLQHALRRSNSIGSTDYNVSRSSTLWVSSKGLGVEPKSSIGSGTFSDDNAKIVTTDSVRLYPGMVVCETLTFKPNNNQVTVASNVSTKICVSAEGDGQPPDPWNPDPGEPDDPTKPVDPDGDDESGAYLMIDVKNNDNSKYGTYRRIVYAKPGDWLTYRSVYNPTLQYTYYLEPEQMQINNGSSKKNSSRFMLGTFFNLNRGSRMPWDNAFNVSSAGFKNSKNEDANISLNYSSYTLGDTSRQRETNDHKVEAMEVGRTLSETAMINQTGNNTVQTTPSHVSFMDISDENVANVMTDIVSSTAYAKIPYNFNTRVDVKTPENEIVYSGEDKEIGFDISILKKKNWVTGDGTDGTSYATKVDNAKWKMITYTTEGSPIGGDEWSGNENNICSYYYSRSSSEDGLDNCGYANEVNEASLNEKGMMDGGDPIGRRSSINIPDIKAGTKICVAVALYPASSGSDTNLDPSGSNTWRISDSKCYTIAKKPSFQLWGGGMYIAGDAKVPVSTKKHLAGYNTYSWSGNPNGYNVFGSWVETGLVAGGSVSGLASGAGTGYTSNNGGNLVADPGGSKEGTLDYCKRSTLSIANDYCGSSYVGNIGGSTLQASMSDKSALVQRLLPDGFSMAANTSAERVDIGSDYTETDSGLRYTYSTNDLIIDGATLENGVTHIVRSDKNITIDGNLLYQNSNYVALNEIPKLIIYGDNITVSCKSDGEAIRRIDAVLIANHTVDTCETTDVNSRENSYQLKINGLIIADTLKLNRTYGAGEGVYSIIPAEIINYDTTLYLWSMVDSPNATGTGKYSESYLHELSPRY